MIRKPINAWFYILFADTAKCVHTNELDIQAKQAQGVRLSATGGFGSQAEAKAWGEKYYPNIPIKEGFSLEG